MSFELVAVQTLNGLQFGLLLFLVAAGLTLVFGVMDFINLAHGTQYMVGAYLAVVGYAVTGHFGLSVALALAFAWGLGVFLHWAIYQHLRDRGHLDQVLATFAVILILTELADLIFGAVPRSLALPEGLDGTFPLTDNLNYPLWRLVMIVAGLAVAAGLFWLVQRTKLGMRLRAGASDREMVAAMGVDIDRLFTVVFGLGAMLAGFAGMMAAPVVAVQPTMGDQVLILAFVVVVIGGIGSIGGALMAALLVGLVDTLGRSFTTDLAKLVFAPATANDVGPAVAAMLVYLLMAAVLVWRPTGLAGQH